MSLKLALELAGAILGLALSIGGASATIWAVSRVRGLDITMGLLKEGNEALRAELTDNERRSSAKHAHLEQTIVTRERACEERVTRLEGQNEALRSGIAERLAEAIGDRLERAVTELASHLVHQMTPPVHTVNVNTGSVPATS